jgi:hypothetical protein
MFVYMIDPFFHLLHDQSFGAKANLQNTIPVVELVTYEVSVSGAFKLVFGQLFDHIFWDAVTFGLEQIEFCLIETGEL